MPSGRLVLVDHRSSHHAGPSGYGRLAQFVNGVVIPERELSFPPWRVQHALARRCGSAYSTTSFSKELLVAARMLRQRAGVVHFLNVEPDFHYTGLLSHLLGWRSIGTFHKPPGQFAELFPQPSFLRRLDGAICVSSSQVAAVRELVGHDRVWFIPLGVDVDFFCPGNNRETEGDYVCLFVGCHLRDYETLKQVATLLTARLANARIVVIVPARYSSDVPAHPRFEMHTGVSDETLRDWYRRADVVVLPLTDATATSSILEAMACGAPVVSSDVGGTPDYVSPECGFLYPVGEAAAMAHGALRLLTDVELNYRMRIAARAHSLRFAWPVVAGLIARLYAEAPAWHVSPRIAVGSMTAR